MATEASSRKRKFSSLAPLAKTAESYMRRLDDAEKESAIIKVVEGNEVNDKRLSLPITWKSASFKRNEMITMINLGDKEKNYNVSFRPAAKQDGGTLLGYLSGGAMPELFQNQSIEAGDKLVLINNDRHTILYVLFRKDTEMRGKYATSFATFKVRFNADRAVGSGVARAFSDDELETYWQVIKGEGNISVHEGKYLPRRSKEITDADIRIIIQNYKAVFDMQVEPVRWNLDDLEVAAEALRGVEAKGYVVSKILALVNVMIIYKDKISQLMEEMEAAEDDAIALRGRYDAACGV